MEEPTQVFFNPSLTQNYKILSVIDGNKCFTIQPDTNKLILQDFTGAPGQNFHIYNNALKYAFVDLTQGVALHIEGENPSDGGVVKGDAGQYPSSFF